MNWNSVVLQFVYLIYHRVFIFVITKRPNFSMANYIEKASKANKEKLHDLISVKERAYNFEITYI